LLRSEEGGERGVVSIVGVLGSGEGFTFY
jgi:hypothetical protein